MHDSHVALALAMGADFVMMGRYFARFDQAAGAKLPTRDGFVKEYRGEGSNRARNWQRYGQGDQALLLEEGVDGYVPYAGDLDEGLALTVAKVRTTMVSCGSKTLPEFGRNHPFPLAIRERRRMLREFPISSRAGIAVMAVAVRTVAARCTSGLEVPRRRGARPATGLAPRVQGVRPPSTQGASSGGCGTAGSGRRNPTSAPPGSRTA